MKKIILPMFLIITILFSCDLLVADKEESIDIVREVEYLTTSDWSDTTHGKSIDPNYDVVFNQNEVLEFNIVIDSEDWEIMQTDLDINLGGAESGGMPPEGGPPMGPRALDDVVSEVSDYDPVWVPCSFNFNDTEWYKVGIRFKGNSSLSSAYNQGINKLSLKLDFDEFEDVYPDIENQRFYGFKQLNLNNNFNDESLMREKVTADMFREYGLVSSQTTFCIINVDYGEGSQFFGLYTLVEEMDDTTIDNQLGDDSGNLYKPDGDAATFSDGSYDQDELVKKSNEDEDDYSDVLALYNSINSSTRESDIDSWMAELESIFDVDMFLKWLAANFTMQNWDTYGNMTHNYYLYNNPETDLLTWIPWDNNEALQDGKQTLYSLSLDEANSEWPLIRYIIDTPEYETKYKEYLQSFISDVFTAQDLQSRYETYYNLIKEYAYLEEPSYTYISSSSSFDSAVDTLKEHVEDRNDAVNLYLGN